MKNKLFKPILLSIMALSLIGCESNNMADKNLGENQVVEAHDEDQNSGNKPAEDDVNKSESKDNKENENKEDSKVEDKKEDEKNLHEKDGKYVTTMIAKLKGEADDYITSTAYDYKFEEDRFVVSGSFDYHEDPENYEKVEEIKNKEDHKFVINDKTVFEAVGGMAPAKEFTKEDFLKYLEECKDTGLALIIFVENGVATSVSISS
ncbi:hypothetical protein [Anaerococcus degeneri]|uniref:Lipoprotein n=1 Tax=Anaerococcus degeneri TaxID=361500 RepID=A0ABS7YXS0_9FIRM|nr:hypothetical protein [Anaerococcus degeneri]MBP2015334.1 hypothetical protein [Anaerococcus degeneri]MCA2096230.1 hypothetical protein [Anaerococcus degeneri]